MLQLLDLARESAALKCELKRVREEARELRLLLGEDGSAEKAGTSLQLVESALRLPIRRLLHLEPLERAPAHVGCPR